MLQIPSGSAFWTNSITISKALRIQGAGTNDSTGTVLRPGADTPFFTFATAALINSQMTLADIQLGPSSFASVSSAGYYVTGCNTNNTYMICSNVFARGATAPTPFVIGAIGVMTRCTWLLTNSIIGCYVYHENWGGYLYSSGSFYDPVNYGSDKFWVIEDSKMIRATATYAFIDAYRGARYVVRYSLLTNCWLEAHGTESGFVRGTRAVESYFNVFHGDGLTDYAHNMRSATLICFSNTIENAGTAGNFAHVDAYRKTEQTNPWGGATGENPIDTNYTTVYASGTATGGGDKFLTDSGKSWTPNEWQGYTLTRMTPLAADTTALTDFRHGFITSNTATTIYVDHNIGGVFPDQVFASGDTYRIYKVYQIFDQPGVADSALITYTRNTALRITNNVARATKAGHGLSTGDVIIIGGDLIVDTAPAQLATVMAVVTNISASQFDFQYYHADAAELVSTFAGEWFKILPYAQTLDPCYEWGNTKEAGADVDFSNGASPILRANEHYYDDTQKPGYTPLEYPSRLLWGGGVTSITIGSADGKAKRPK